MKVKTWKILDRGDVPLDAGMIEYECACGYEAALPVRGRVLAQVAGGLVFDTNERGALPKRIQCRRCGRVLELDGIEQHGVLGDPNVR